MAEAIDQVMAELQAAAAAIRARGAMVLPPAGMLRLERRAVDVARALLDGEALPEDGTDELLSVEAEVSSAQGEQRPAVDGPGEEADTADLQPVAVAAGVVVAAVGAASEEEEEEDVLDEATVIESSADDTPGVPAVAWEDAQTFVAEEDSEVPLEFVESAGAPSSPGEEVLYVIEEEAPAPAEEEAPAPPSDFDEDGSDDPSDAGLVSFTEGDASYITYEETEPEETPDPTPPPAADDSLYVSYDEVPVGGMSDADLALGSGDFLDEDEEVTLGSIPRPEPPARLGGEEADESSFSDVGEDALVTIGDQDVLGDLDASDDGVETFDLIPDESDDDPVLEDDEEVTLVSGIGEDEDSDDEIAEVDIDDDDLEDEVMIDDSRGGGVHVAAPRVAAASPRVTAGLYGNPSVPTIREGNDPVPKAAAVQLNSAGGGRMLGLEEEEEPIELGSVGDYGEDEDEYDGGDGLSLAIQEYEQEYEEEEEEEEELELEPEPAPPPPPRGPSPEEIQAVFERAQAAAHSGALQDAADLYSDVVDADPDHLDAHVGRGRLYLDLGDYSRAMSDFMVAEEIDESSPEPQVAIGDLYFHRKDYRKAIEYFDTALKMSPNHAMAFCRRGISHYYRKNYKEALGDLEKANSIDSDIPNIASFISMAKRKAKRK